MTNVKVYLVWVAFAINNEGCKCSIVVKFLISIMSIFFISEKLPVVSIPTPVGT